jgi:hypothetical protein
MPGLIHPHGTDREVEPRVGYRPGHARSLPVIPVVPVAHDVPIVTNVGTLMMETLVQASVAFDAETVQRL